MKTIWYYRPEHGDSEALRMVLGCSTVTHVLLRCRSRYDPPLDGDLAALCQQVRDAGKVPVLSRWLWQGWESPTSPLPSTLPHAIRLAQSPEWLADQLTALFTEAAGLNAECAIDTEPYSNSPLLAYCKMNLCPAWRAAVQAYDGLRADYVMPACFEADRWRISFYGLYDSLGKQRVAKHTYWADLDSYARDPRRGPYEIFGACVGQNHPSRQPWDPVALFGVGRRYWKDAQGLYLYSLAADVDWVARRLATLSGRDGGE